MYSVAIVCEGDADRVILTAVLDHYLGDYEPVSIQPPRGAFGGDSGPLGGGWKGVRRWCQQEAPIGGGPLRVLLENHDFVVVQVDADVAKERDSGIDLADDARCPPPSAFSDPVRAAVLGWIGIPTPPTGLVLCVPAMATETWALVALFAETLTTADPSTCIECDERIKQKLRKLGKPLAPKLVSSEGGRLKNHSKGYQAVAARITQSWLGVVSMCREAARFHEELGRRLRAPAIVRRARRRLRWRGRRHDPTRLAVRRPIRVVVATTAAPHPATSK
jgi:hypothetical protein